MKGQPLVEWNLLSKAENENVDLKDLGIAINSHLKYHQQCSLVISKVNSALVK